jgi:hypothetical protein
MQLLMNAIAFSLFRFQRRPEEEIFHCIFLSEYFRITERNFVVPFKELMQILSGFGRLRDAIS